jgi:hypothetical protein
VRQQCDDFWKSPETIELRLPGTNATAKGQNPLPYGDVTLTHLPTDRRSDGAFVGEGVADGIGPIRVRIGAHLCPPISEAVVGARILGAKFTKEGDEQVICTTTGTEVFWM